MKALLSILTGPQQVAAFGIVGVAVAAFGLWTWQVYDRGFDAGQSEWESERVAELEKSLDETSAEAARLRAEAQERDRAYADDLTELKRRANAAARRDSVSFSPVVVGVLNDAKARANADIAAAAGGPAETVPADGNDNPRHDRRKPERTGRDR